MSKIIKIEAEKIFVGLEDGSIKEVPISAANFNDPQVGDEVETFGEGEIMILTRKQVAPAPVQVNVQQESTLVAKEKRINKHIFVWIGTFLVGGFGVDRFMRGQVGLGIFKLLIGSWLTLGIWPLVDWIIGMIKAYGNSFGKDEDLVFLNGKYAK